MNEELNPGAFFKISRSCIIAMKSIKSIIKQPGGRLRIVTTIDSHFEMTVSRSRVDDFLIWLEK
jgi:DNA-binding LytR/AlgR family response regulator